MDVLRTFILPVALLMMWILVKKTQGIDVTAEHQTESGNRLTTANPNEMHPFTLCENAEEKVACYNQLIGKILHEENIAEDIIVEKEISKRPSDSDWKTLCPDYKSKSDCLANYLSLLSVNTPRSIKYKRNGGKSAKRSPSWQVCANSYRKVDCFENYMSMWLHYVSGNGGDLSYKTGVMGTVRKNRMNSFVGKRSDSSTSGPKAAVQLPPFSAFRHLCPDHSDLNVCFAAYIRFVMRNQQPGEDVVASFSKELGDIRGSDLFKNDASENTAEQSVTSVPEGAGSDETQCKRLSCLLYKMADKLALVESVQEEDPLPPTVKRSAYDKLCPDGIDTTSCFENYIRFIAKQRRLTTTKHGKYIGRVRRSADHFFSSDSRQTTLDEGENKLR